MNQSRVAVWIDHKEARVVRLDSDGHLATTIKAPPKNIHHKHPNGPEGPKDHPNDAQRFYEEVAKSLGHTNALLIVGPGTAKLEFLQHVRSHDPSIDPHGITVQTVDHPTDGQLVAFAKKHFEEPARVLRPQ
jgi:stalled ribosome rescue protein Dom34